jgi:glutaredoxin-related protein
MKVKKNLNKVISKINTNNITKKPAPVDDFFKIRNSSSAFDKIGHMGEI